MSGDLLDRRELFAAKKLAARAERLAASVRRLLAKRPSPAEINQELTMSDNNTPAACFCGGTCWCRMVDDAPKRSACGCLLGADGTCACQRRSGPPDGQPQGQAA